LQISDVMHLETTRHTLSDFGS